MFQEMTVGLYVPSAARSQRDGSLLYCLTEEPGGVTERIHKTLADNAEDLFTIS